MTYEDASEALLWAFEACLNDGHVRALVIAAMRESGFDAEDADNVNELAKRFGLGNKLLDPSDFDEAD